VSYILNILSGLVWSWLNRHEAWLVPFLEKVERHIPKKSVWLVYATLWLVFLTTPFLIVGWLFTLSPVAEICRMAIYSIWLTLMLPVTKAVIEPFTLWRRTRIK